MSIVITLINRLFLSLGSTLVASVLYEKITGNNTKRGYLFIVTYCAALVATIAPKFVTLIIMASIILFFYIISKDFSASIASGIITLLIQYICMIIPEIFVVLFVKDLSLQMQKFSYNLLISLVFTVTMYIANLIIKKSKIRLNVLSNIEFNKTLIFTTLNIIALIACICTVVYVSHSDIDYVNKMFIIYANFVITFIITILLSFFVYRELLKNKIKETKYNLEIELNAKFRNDVRNLYDDIMDFKHDYLKIFSTLRIYFDNQDYAALSQYFDKNIAPLNDKFKLANSNIASLTHVEDAPLQSILYTFLINAQNCNVEVEMGIDENIPKLKIDILMFSRAIGIFLENALDECQKIYGAKVVVIITNSDDKIKITIKNTLTAKIDNISMLLQRGYTTKNTEGRGLAIAHEILNKFDNVEFFLDADTQSFMVMVSINNK